MTSEPLRYRLLVLMCRLLRHPARRVEREDGSARAACPCGFISYSDIPFRVRKDGAA